MADLNIGNSLGVAACGQTSGKTNINGGDEVDNGHWLTAAGVNHIEQMKARLTALNATTWTVARMHSMTFNDLVYAIRVTEHGATIK